MNADNISNVLSQTADDLSNSIQEGFKTIGDLIQAELAKSGTQQAAAFEVTINGGVTNLVTSDAQPIYNQPVSEDDRVEIRKVNSATAGIF